MYVVPLGILPASRMRRPRQTLGFFIHARHVVSSSASIEAWITGARYARGDWYVLPAAPQDQSADSQASFGGLVWLADRQAQAIEAPDVSIPLICTIQGGGSEPLRLWHSFDARIQPICASPHLVDALPDGLREMVWLPAIGLTGFEASDRIEPGDWVSARRSGPDAARFPTSPLNWSSPPDVPRLASSLTSIMVALPITPETTLDDVRNELGEPSRSLVDADVQGNALSPSLSQRFKKGLLRSLDRWIGKRPNDVSPPKHQMQVHPPEAKEVQAPGQSSKQTLAGLLSKFLNRPLQTISSPIAAYLAANLQKQREEQLDKLLEMFRDNPDLALKYAIPVGEIDTAFRGFAIPGAQLIARLTDFSFSNLRNGGLADFWDIGSTRRAKLIAGYRMQANRELAIGRYRRAAYIFANLLSDLFAAASALEQGKFYIEAAAIYRDRLSRREDAARCLELAGQFEQAAELYMEHGMLLEAASVWKRAEEFERARIIYHRAYEELIARHDYLGAANLLHQHLNDTTGAIDLLIAQWPSGHNLVASLNQAILWLGEDGQHARTLELIAKLSASEGPVQCTLLVEIFAHATQQYPDHAVRRRADDCCRLATARVLGAGDPLRSRAALSCLSSLPSHRRQLARDCARFQSQFLARTSIPRQASSVPSTPTQRVQKANLRYLEPLTLPPNLRLLDVQTTNEHLVCLAQFGGRLWLYARTIESPVIESISSGCLISSLDTMDRRDIWIGSASSRGVRSVTAIAYAPIDRPEIHNEAGGESPSKLNMKLLLRSRDHSVAACVINGSDIWSVTEQNGQWTLRHKSQSSSSGNPMMQTFDLGMPLLTQTFVVDSSSHVDQAAASPTHPPCLRLFSNTPVVSIGQSLLTVQDNRALVLHETAGTIHDLAMAPPQTLARVLIAHMQGLDAVALNGHGYVAVCRDRSYQFALFFPGGVLAGWSDDRLYLFRIHQQVGYPVGNSHALRPDPIGLVRLSSDTVGVVYAAGSIERVQFNVGIR